MHEPEEVPPSDAVPPSRPTVRAAAAGGGWPRGEPVAVILASDALRWLLPAVAKYPRSHRYSLGSRLEGSLLDVLESLVTAQYARGGRRYDALQRANQRLQVVRLLSRLSGELKFLTPRQLEHFMPMVVELGRQIGGWSKASESTANSSIG